MKIVTATQMRVIDQECVRRGIPVSTLMENAGKAVAEATRDLLTDIKKQHILCLIGAGNNGGDGLAAARYLAGWGAKVIIYLCSDRPADDENLRLVKEHGITCLEAKTDNRYKKLDGFLASTTGVIDALLGTGKMRPLEGVFKEVLEKVNASKTERKFKIVAVDLPSGMDADTGAIDPACPSADLTVTLAFPKPGLFQFPGAEKAGKLKIVDIGIPASLAEAIKIELITAEWAASVLPKRPQNANKGSFGKVLVNAGSINYTGAAYLACSGALRVGAGLVTLAARTGVASIVAARLTEATYLPLPETPHSINAAEAVDISLRECGNYNVLLTGCGLGQNPATVEYVTSILTKVDIAALVVDADGLNILANIPDWPAKIPKNAILTPHPGEMARLTGLSIEAIQKDRAGTAIRYAREWQRTVVLKGAFTIIAAPDGRCRVSPYANPGLASAGTGDVLAGVIAGLAGQGPKLYDAAALGVYFNFDAAALGVYLHGEAGEKVKAEMGDTGMLASDLLPWLPKIIKELKNLT
jgi:ADP-dependent NAD(P)H-hydrate dehydratase / NAD(P)H-hydrate epimerase